MSTFNLTYHAVQQFRLRAERLGLTTSLDWLNMALAKSREEDIRRSNPITRLHGVMRELKYGRYERRTYKGWRFIIQNGDVRTIERIRPYENYVIDRFSVSPLAAPCAETH